MKLRILSILVLLASFASAQEPLWLRYPSISPDGSKIAFTYMGDIYLVDAAGGEAKALTTHGDHDFMPMWSPDGKTLVFASNRYGNYDVFTMPAEGGKAARVTYHSSSDYPCSMDANGTIYFSSTRLDSYKNSQFPSGVLSELYAIDKDGKLTQVLTTPAESASWNKDGSKLIYQDRKGYENQWRKHHTSSVTRDIWIYDKASKEHTRVSPFNGEDRNPVWSSNESAFYYLSEESGSFNVWKRNVDGSSGSQLTSFEKHPVRFLSMSNDGTLAFSFDGQLYTMKGNGEPQKLSIQIKNDTDFNLTELIDVKGEVSELSLSPNGKEIAFVAHGEIFVTSTDYSETKRITNTPEQERDISFSPDGRSILFAGERNESWNLYQVKLTQEDEKYFYASSVLEEEEVLVSEQETFQAQFSPDGKEVAFLEERVILRVINLESKEIRTILGKEFNYSYSDGDQGYEWSPDGKWFLVQYLPYNRWNGDVGLVSSDGKERINLTESGYECYGPQWIMGGEAIMWFSGRNGMKSHGSWGSQEDTYAMFLTGDSYEKFNMSESEAALAGERKKDESKDEEDEKSDKKKKKKDDEEEEVEAIKFDLDNMKDRTRRLTMHSSGMGDAIMKKDGSKMFYLSAFEKGFDLWVQDFRKHETKLLAKLGGRSGELKFDKDEANIFVITNSGIQIVNAESGSPKPVGFSAKMELNQQEEFEYIFNHAWRQTLKKFYVEDMHGVDWEFYKNEYAKFLPHINNGPDFAEMLSELLGELNASHTGSGYRFRKQGGDNTASLGIYPNYEFAGPGVKVDEIIHRSPLLTDDSGAKAGMTIVELNNVAIKNLEHYYLLLNNQAGKNVMIKYIVDGKEKSKVFKPMPMGSMWNLAYERYVKKCNAMVEELSNGKVGYVHVRGMDDESFRQVYSDALGKHADKESLIVDTRFNGGGWLHDDLATFLGGKMYATFLPRGQKIGHEPLAKWFRPSAVLIGEGNYSDAHGFPFAYRALELGKTIGMPVPGTMTAVWWETQINRNIYFGIPQVGMQDNDGKLQENYQFEPDIKVENDYKSVSEGRDKQIEEAVKHLMKK